MTIDVRQQTEITDALAGTLERLMPQLSAQLGAPSRASLERIVQGPCTALFAAWAGDEAVGVLTLTWYDVPSGRKAWIEDVVVDAAWRGCGAGEELVRAAVRHAVQIGAERVMLTSSPRREAARALYRRVGFTEAETSVFVLKTDI